MNLAAEILAILPPGLPGKGHMAIAKAVQHRNPLERMPTHQELRSALGQLERRGLVHSVRRPDEHGQPTYLVFWREASYVPPLDVKVSS